MTKYGQFCPIAKAAEILGERWMLLIVRELILGSTRFNELQRALSLISPSLLTKRLNELIAADLLIKEKQPGQRNSTYILTPEGLALAPLIENLAVWGMKWVRSGLDDDDLDAEFLMWDIKRRIDISQLPGNHSVIHFNFKNLKDLNDFWVVRDYDDVDLCTKNPGREVDLHISSTLKDMADIWMGNIPISHAKEYLYINGNVNYTKRFKKWFTLSLVAAT